MQDIQSQESSRLIIQKGNEEYYDDNNSECFKSIPRGSITSRNQDLNQSQSNSLQPSSRTFRRRISLERYSQLLGNQKNQESTLKQNQESKIIKYEKVDTLQQQLQNLNSENQKLKNQVSQLEIQKKHIENNFQNIKQSQMRQFSFSQQNQDIQGILQNKQQLEEKVRLLASENDRLHSLYNRSKNNLKNSVDVSNNKKLLEIIENLKLQLQNSKENFKSYQDNQQQSKNASNQQLNNLIQKLKIQEDNNKKLLDRQIQSQDQGNILREEFRNTQDQLYQLKKEKQEFQILIKKEEIKNQNLQNQIQNLKIIIEKNIEEKKLSMQQFNQQQEDCQKQIQYYSSKVKEEINYLEQQKSEIEQQKIQLEQQKNILQQEVQSHKQVIEKQTKENDEYVKKLVITINQQSEAITILKKNQVTIQNNFEQKQQEIITQNQQKIQENHQLKNDLQQLEEELEKMQNDYYFQKEQFFNKEKKFIQEIEIIKETHIKEINTIHTNYQQEQKTFQIQIDENLQKQEQDNYELEEQKRLVQSLQRENQHLKNIQDELENHIKNDRQQFTLEINKKENQIDQFEKNLCEFKLKEDILMNKEKLLNDEKNEIIFLKEENLQLNLERNKISKTYQIQIQDLESELNITKKNLECINKDYELIQKELESTIEQYEIKLKNLRKEIQSKKNIEGSLKTEYECEITKITQQLKNEINMKKEQFLETEKENFLLKNQNENLLKDIKKLEIQIEELNKELEQNKEKFQNKILVIKQEIQKYEIEQNKNLKQDMEIDNLQREKQQLNERIDNLTNYYQKLLENADQFQNEAEKKFYDFKNQNENQKFQLQTELKTKNVKVNTLTFQVQSLEENLNDLEKKYEQIVSQNDYLKLREIELLKQNEKQKENLNDLNIKQDQQSTFYQQDIKIKERHFTDQIKLQNKEQKKTIEKLQQKIFDLKEEIVFYTMNKQQLEKELNDLKESYQNTMNDNNDDQENLKEKNQYLNKQVQIFENELKENQKETKNMIFLYEKKLKDQEQCFDEERKNFRDKIFDLKKDYQEEVDEVKNYQRQIQTTRKDKRLRIQQFQQTIDRLNEKIFFYEKQIHTYELNIKEKKEENQILIKKQDENEELILSLKSNIIDNQNQLEILKVNLSQKQNLWEQFTSTKESNESEIVKLENLCYLASQKNQELVDHNNSLLLKIFQLKLLLDKKTVQINQQKFQFFLQQKYQQFMEDQVVVIDNGSGYSKIGFFSENEPQIKIPTLIGKPKYQNEFLDLPFSKKFLPKKKNQKYIPQQKKIIGNEALNSPSIYNISFPIKHGIIENTDDLLDLYFQVYIQDLQLEPATSPLLITSSLRTTNQCHEKLLEIAFEYLRVPFFGITQQTNCSLKALGRVTGLVVDSGYGLTQIVPIVDDFLISKGNMSSRFMSGYILNELIQDYISRCKIYEIDLFRDFKLLEQIKQDFSSIDSLNSEQKLTKTLTFTNRYTQNLNSKNICELPDGSVADLSMIPSITTDLFFNNEVFGYEGNSLGGMIAESIDKCDIDIKKDLYQNIFIQGGNSKIKNFQEQTMNDLKNHMMQISGELKNINYENDSQDLVWQGAVIEAMLDPHLESNYWSSKEEYEDEGHRLIKKFNKQ